MGNRRFPPHVPNLLRAQIELEAGSDRTELPESARLELANALAGDTEVRPHLFERPRTHTVEAEAFDDHAALARLKLPERGEELGGARFLDPLESLAQADEQLALGRDRGLRAVCERLIALT